MNTKIKRVIKRTALIGMVAAVAMGAFTGCGSKSDQGGTSSDGSDQGGNVVIAGSTSVQPLSEVLAAGFMEDNAGITVEIQGGGSGQGIKAIEEKIADIGSLSRELKDSEKALISKEIVIAMDGVAVIVNENCTATDLTLEQIKKIYTGEVTNWKEVGGQDAPIVVVSREEGSGTRGAFTEITGVLEKDANGDERDNTTVNALVQPSTGAVKTTVAKTPDTIGYISMGALDDSVKAVKVEGVDATSENVLAKTYLISRPFIYVTGEKVTDAAQSFIDYVLSDVGQVTVAEHGFIPVNK